MRPGGKSDPVALVLMEVGESSGNTTDSSRDVGGEAEADQENLDVDLFGSNLIQLVPKLNRPDDWLTSDGYSQTP